MNDKPEDSESMNSKKQIIAISLLIISMLIILSLKEPLTIMVLPVMVSICLSLVGIEYINIRKGEYLISEGKRKYLGISIIVSSVIGLISTIYLSYTFNDLRFLLASLSFRFRAAS